MAQERNPMRPQLFWQFKARYKNGEVFENPDFVQKVDRDRIQLIGLFYKGQYRGTIEYKTPEQRPILVRRTRIFTNTELGEIGRAVIVLVGWQATVGGRNVKSVLELHPDGSMVMMNHDGRP